MLPLSVEVSRLLYLLDREAYVEALNASRTASSNEGTDSVAATAQDMEATS